MERLLVEDVLAITVNILGDISVPRKLNEQIGIPIDHAIGNIRECIRAIQEAHQPEEPENAEPADDGEESDEEANEEANEN